MGEPVIANKKITALTTGRFSFVNKMGSHSVAVFDSGNYLVAPDFLNYYNAVPASHSATFSGIHQTDSLNDFAFQPAKILMICVSPLRRWARFVPGSIKVI